METLLLCLELMNVIGKALTHHRKILQNACAPILKNYHDDNMSSNIRPQLPDSIFLLSMCYPSTDLTSLASPFFPLLAVQSASFAFYAFHQATVRLRESLSIPPQSKTSKNILQATEDPVSAQLLVSSHPTVSSRDTGLLMLVNGHERRHQKWIIQALTFSCSDTEQWWKPL